MGKHERVQQEDWHPPLAEELYRAIDPFELGPIIGKAQLAWWSHPKDMMNAIGNWQSDALRWQAQAWRRLLGEGDEDEFPANPSDDRFADEAWRSQPGWDMLKEWYLFNTRWLQDTLYATPELSDKERNLSAFWLRQYLNALAPTNYLPFNPRALEKARETGGESLLNGLRNFLRDMEHGDIAMTDRDAFQVGVNLATTPGAVVYRGPLLEVLHYQATTEKVRAVPIVIVSPWINKYYVLDLDAKKSMVSWLVSQGFSVFITSWKNPREEARDLAFDDYIHDGIDRIVEVARKISGSEQVHLTGYCIGGTLTATYLAWLAARKQAGKVASATLLTTLTDFARPGDIEVFLGEEGLDFVERKMAQRGYLDGKDMASSFRMLRANSLVWNYWVGNYLLGETPRAFDILYWNMDTTRMPQQMHSFYLREFYYHNKLCQPDALVIAGEPIDLQRIETPLFMVSTEEDHIAPWKQTWKLTQHVSGPITFTLSSSGHILGIVNPPSPGSKRQYWQGTPQQGQSADYWLAHHEAHAGSWWPSWVEWLTPRSGDMVPFKLDSKHYPQLGPAPGTYVLG
ncbi:MULTISPECIES: alpha/beta hydrolase [unclassified Paludibacterium]|uniref:PHA/PHB synthase family protein n=1 Tax=unclassified Paludibacterium TaxID=2618429 RepID=UPI001C055515|nr:alpha/beta fold hydrolase [Paludibacterium sp. B53371]BEV72137.1 class I poly(R)-hydroxyalkanoic acid synthase [Paludibacterium sp. THUN1379]